MSVPPVVPNPAPEFVLHLRVAQRTIEYSAVEFWLNMTEAKLAALGMSDPARAVVRFASEKLAELTRPDSSARSDALAFVNEGLNRGVLVISGSCLRASTRQSQITTFCQGSAGKCTFRLHVGEPYTEHLDPDSGIDKRESVGVIRLATPPYPSRTPTHRFPLVDATVGDEVFGAGFAVQARDLDNSPGHCGMCLVVI